MKQIDRICNMNAEEMAEFLVSKIDWKGLSFKEWLESEVEE